MNNVEKNNIVKETIKSTRERHSNMDCRVFEVKVVGSKLNNKQKEQINQYFREAKWRRNDSRGYCKKNTVNRLIILSKLSNTRTTHVLK